MRANYLIEFQLWLVVCILLANCFSFSLETTTADIRTTIGYNEKQIIFKGLRHREDWMRRNFRLNVMDDGKVPELPGSDESTAATACGKSKDGDDQQFSVKSTIYKNATLWPISPSGFYEIGYDIRPGDYPEETIERITWSLEYFEQGTNIRFHRRTSTDEKYLYFVSEPGKGCAANVGMCLRGACVVYLEYPACDERHAIVHEIMHRLGFGHEHQRPDAAKHVRIAPSTPESWIKWLQPDSGLSDDTPYDIASIMQYDTFLESLDPAHEQALHGRVPALTSCDYNRLNTFYPANEKTKNPKGPPKCMPHEFVNVVRPSEKCARLWGAELCSEYCYGFADTEGELHHKNGSRETVKMCVFDNDERFPRDAMWYWRPPPVATEKCVKLLESSSACGNYCRKAGQIWASQTEGFDNGLCLQSG